MEEWSCGVHPKPFGNVVGSPAVPATDSVADLGGGGGGGAMTPFP